MTLRIDPVEEMTVTELDQLSDWVAAFKRAKELESQAAAKKEEYRAMIAQYLDDHGAEYGTIRGKVAIRWRTVTSNRFSNKKFKAENPDMYAEYVEPTESKRMEIVDD